MADIRTVIRTEITNAQGERFIVEEESRRHVGDNPRFLAGEADAAMDEVQRTVLDAVSARFKGVT